MRLYYYAYTGHKYGLDRMKRAVVLLNGLREKGIDTMLLVNDFRAGLAARDFGISESVTIEGIQDIDAIAKVEDCVIIDSPEDDHGRLVKYCSDFKRVFRFAETDDDKTIHGEVMLTVDCDNDACISANIVDDFYFKEHKKEERTLFFLGDSDADKIILNNADAFVDQNMELLLGHYFYVKYESDLEKIFSKLHESEEYMELIATSSRVVTASYQTALEAKVAGAEVIFINLKNLEEKKIKLLKLLNIEINNSILFNRVEQKELESVVDVSRVIEKNETLVTKIINML